MSTQNNFGYRLGTQGRPQSVNLALSDGGLGDQVARLPALVYLLRTYPNLTVRVFLPDHFTELAKEVLAPFADRVQFSTLTELRQDKANGKRFFGGTTSNPGHSTLKTHLTHHAFHTLLDMEPPSASDCNYPSLVVRPVSLSGKYIVLTTGFTAKVREFPAKEINKTAQWCLANGYKVVFLGANAAPHHDGYTIMGEFDKTVDYTVGLDLRDKTTLREAVDWLGNASAVVGVDNGLLHLAACTEVPIVAGYTTLNPRLRLPYRHGILGFAVEVVEPEESLGCRGCQSVMYDSNFDFRNCWYGDYACVKQMESIKFIEALRKVLNVEQGS